MSLLLFLFFGTVATQPVTDLAWEYHQKQLKTSLDSAAWFEAKRALAFLQQQDLQRYDKMGLNLTLARIYQREQLNGSALSLYASIEEPHPVLLLERMALLQHVADFKAVLELGQSKALSKYTKGRTKRLLLMAQAHESLNQQNEADQIYRQLTRRGPTAVKQESYLKLAQSAYADGRIKQARKYVETLQKKWATSDEALQAVHLQLAQETQDYREHVSNIHRWAKVCYSNRAFDLAEEFYEQVAAKSKVRKVADGARYRLAMLPLKQGDPEAAIQTLKPMLARLEKGDYGDQASFQYARALLMAGRDQDVIAYCEQDWSTPRDSEWREYHAKVHLQALRRQEDFNGFMRMEQRLRRAKVSRSMMREFHRHAVIWSLQRDMPKNAQVHLKRFKERGVPKRMRQEVLVWEGMIHQALGEMDNAIKSWLAVVAKDPNHFFGLVAREKLQASLLQHDVGHLTQSQSRRHSALLQAYYLQPERHMELTQKLQDSFKPPVLQDAQNALPADHPVLGYLAIHRYDLAAATLTKRDVPVSTYHFLKAKWYALDGDPHSSIRHAEVLADAFPSWVPYELMPLAVQELLFPRGFNQLIEREALRQGVDPYLLLAIIREESRFNTNAKSWASARGLMQFIPSTAKTIAAEVDIAEDFDLGQLYVPETAITLGARYVNNLMDFFEGKSLYTVAAYNAGESAVQRWASFSKEYNALFFIWDITYSETKFYCQKVLRAYHHYARVYDTVPPAPLLDLPGNTAIQNDQKRMLKQTQTAR